MISSDHPYGMHPLWNAAPMECSPYGMYPVWNAAPYGMQPPWNAVSRMIVMMSTYAMHQLKKGNTKKINLIYTKV